MCSESYSKPAETCRLCCLEESDEVLLKAVSVTDFKNMFQRTCKDTRLTLTDTVQLSFLSPTLEMVLFTETISEVTTQRSYEKWVYQIKNIEKWLYQLKIWHSSFMAKQLSAVFCLLEKPETLWWKIPSKILLF